MALIHKLQPISCDKELMRLGPRGDGGYLVPDDVEGIEACFSPGVGALSEFEKDCAGLGMEVFLADKSVDGPSFSHERFHFTKKHLGALTSGDSITMDDWVDISLQKSPSDLLLQMDIEGYEYETFLGMSDSLIKRFRIIVVELHGLDMLWSEPFFGMVSTALEKIIQNHVCVHLHPNNNEGFLSKGGLDIPRVMEFTFLRKDRVISPSPTHSFPHPLDSDNFRKPPLRLPECWYKKQ